MRVDQGADLYKQSIQQRKDSQAPEEGARSQIDSAAVSDKQEARGRPRDIKKAQRLPQRRQDAMMSAEEKRQT